MLPRLVVLVATLGAGAVGVVRGTWAVGGSDSSCYALMADAFARGDLQPTSTLAVDAPWPDAPRTLAPGGFIPSPVVQHGASPICAPGYSLVLAAARAVGGRDAIFFVTPVAGALLVWLTFLFGRQLAGDVPGVAAAVLVATTPVFLFQIVQPMNDVVVAALWTAAAVVAARATDHKVRPRGSSKGFPQGGDRVHGEDSAVPGFWRSWVALGGVTGLAVLVRPNLALAAVVVVAWVWMCGRRLDRPWAATAMFLLGCMPFAALMAWLNSMLYGHPLSFGYGRASDLFAIEHVGVNLSNYSRALLQTQLGFPLLGVAAVWLVPRGVRSLAWLATGITGAVVATYLLYSPFPEWWYLRFLLPVLPMMTALAIAVVAGWKGAWRVVHVLVLVVLVGYTTTSEATRQALDLARLERRFRTSGQMARERFSEDAVFITVWESGSVKYHGGRDAVLWDSLDPTWLDRTIDWLHARGLEPFIMVEQWEETAFRQRFSPYSPLGNLDWPPRFDIERQVRIWDPTDRARYLAGETWATEIVRADRR